MLWLLLLLAVFSFGRCKAPDEIVVDPSITKITEETFKNITGASRPFNTSKENLTADWFIMFYSPTCPHCVKTMPSWNEFGKAVSEDASRYPAGLRIGVVDCKANKKLCNESNIDLYPTFLLFKQNHTLVKADKDKNKEAWTRFVRNQLYKPEAGGLGLVGGGAEADNASLTNESDKQKDGSGKQKKKGSKVSDPNANETVITKSWKFLTSLTSFQWFELLTIIATAAALTYLLFYCQDEIEFKRLADSRHDDMRVLGLREQS